VTFYPLVNLGGGLAGRRSGGDGDVVFWVHPYALDSSCWAELWERLPGWRHVGVDLPGHGLSEPLDPRDDLAALTTRLREAAAREGARHLVGLSLGANLALAMALGGGPTFASVVLASPELEDTAVPEGFWRRYRELATMYMMAGFGEHLRGRLMLVEPGIFDGTRPLPGLWERLWRIVGRHPFWDLAYAGYARVASTAWPEDALRGMGLPTLLVVGESAAAGSKAEAVRWAAALPTSRLTELPGAAHLSLLETPEAAAAALDAHLGGHALPSTEGRAKVEAGA
jgi:pimeloyl-ACP methyl ester carboxylesterase